MHEAVLAPGVLPVAQELGRLPQLRNFCLAGGTGLALQLGHRQSRDLDFFTRQPVHKLNTKGLTDWLPAHFPHVELVDRQADQIHYVVDGVSLTFLAYPFVRPFSDVEWRGLNVADARSIAVQKAYTIGRRPQARDYLDLEAVLAHGILGLGDIVSHASKVYGEAFSPKLFLQQLTYTRDIADATDAISLLVEPRAFSEVEASLRRHVIAFVKQELRAPSTDIRAPRL